MIYEQPDWFNPRQCIAGKIYSKVIVEIDCDTIMRDCVMIHCVIVMKNSAKLRLINCRYHENFMVMNGNSHVLDEEYRSFPIGPDVGSRESAFVYTNWCYAQEDIKLLVRAYDVSKELYK